ncbi:MAG: pyridoxamine 5'-phosphate oxidase family protein [Mucilaginibacter sp.]
MTKDFVYDFISGSNLGVVSTISPDIKPEAALIGIAVSTDLEIVFDTVKTSRKYHNILKTPFVALVIGWDGEITVQLEGRATVLTSSDEHLKEIYFDVYPDGRERAKTWPDIVHFKITPTWIRYSNFNEPVLIEEMSLPF